MKRCVIALVCACSLILASLGMIACSEGAPVNNSDKDKITVVTTIFPEYDWAKNVIGDTENVDLVFLQNSGADLHNYQPSVQDLATVADCDVFVYVGGESDGWVDDALSSSANEDMQVVNLMDVMGSNAKVEEVVEGMEAEEEEGEEGEESEEEGPEYDEHVWLSLKNAAACTNAICDALCAADSSNADAYKANAESYCAQLQSMDEEYASAISSCSKNTVVFGDRFPFRYLVDDYGLKYYAAFVGCSAESEASFETVLFLANKVDELGLDYVMAIEGADHKIAQAVVSNTKDKDQEVLVVDSMQSTTQEAVDAGANYLDAMSANLKVITQALS